MDLNYFQQSKYSPGKFKVLISVGGVVSREVSYLELSKILRDLAFARQQSANYISLYGGQFDFNEILKAPYWEYLFLSGDIQSDELVNVQEGCLLIISLMFMEVYDDEGSSYIFSQNVLEQIDFALANFNPPDERLMQIKENVMVLRRYIEDDKVLRRSAPDNLSIENELNVQKSAAWLFRELVENYFKTTYEAFEVERQKSLARIKSFGLDE